MDSLILRLNNAEPAAAWCRGEAPERVEHGALQEAAQAATGRRVTVLVPSENVLLTSAHLPLRQRQRLLQALPYALEEQLTTDVELLHFAAAEARDDGETRCAVIEKTLLQNWLDQLGASAVDARALVPDILALPRAPGSWTLLLEAQRFVLRTGTWQGLAFELDALAQLLPLALRDADEELPARLRVIDRRGSEERLPLEQWCGSHQVAIEYDDTTADALTLLARTVTAELPLNLLQGAYSRREQRGLMWRPWRATAALAALLLVLQGAMAITGYVKLRHEDRRLSSAIYDLYMRTFPGAKRIEDARVQMEQKLKALHRTDTGQQFHRLLAASAGALNDNDIKLRTLHYAPGLIEVEVNASDLQALDRIKQTLDGHNGLHVEITGADSNNGKVTGHVTIHGSGS